MHPFYQWQVSYKSTEKQKSHKTLFNQSHMVYITLYHPPWLIIPSGVDTQTDRQTHILIHKQKQF